MPYRRHGAPSEVGVMRDCVLMRRELRPTHQGLPTPPQRAAEAMRQYVSFEHVQKTYDGAHLAVADLTLTIERGEFLTFLGPSGSGKTTALMMLAGFEAPTAGEIQVEGRSLRRVPPHRRNIGVVFQNFALFPHMTVEENLAFPLSVR